MKAENKRTGVKEIGFYFMAKPSALRKIKNIYFYFWQIKFINKKNTYPLYF